MKKADRKGALRAPRVLILASWYPSRRNPLSGIFIKEQAEALARRGLDVQVLHVVVAQRGRGERILSFEHGRKDGVATTIILAALPLRRSLTRQRLEYLVTLIAYFSLVRTRPDIIHAHSAIRGGMLADRLGRLLGLPVVITEHNTAFLRGIYSAGTIGSIKGLFERSASIIAVSRYFAERLAEIVGVEAGRIEYIPNLVDTEFFSPLGASSKEPRGRLCMVCLLSPKKRVELAIEALALLRDRGLEVTLRIAGEGEEGPRLERLVAELGLGEAVSFLGRLDRAHTRDLINDSDIMLSTSEVETFGVTLIEALACGLPVLATDSGGPSSIIGAHNGAIVPRGDAAALADAIEKMLFRYASYDKALIREDCVRRFGAMAVTNEIIARYRRIMTSSRRGGRKLPGRVPFGAVRESTMDIRS